MEWIAYWRWPPRRSSRSCDPTATRASVSCTLALVARRGRLGLRDVHPRARAAPHTAPDARLLRRPAGPRVAADGAQPAVLHLRDHRFFHAALLPAVAADSPASRPRRSSINTLITGFPWPTSDLLVPVRRAHRHPDRSRSASGRSSRAAVRAERAAPPGDRPARGGAGGERRPAAPSSWPRPARPGVLDERARMAREIHDTIAQGLTGIVTQLEAAEQAAIDRTTGSGTSTTHAAGAGEPDRGPPLGRGVAARKPSRAPRCEDGLADVAQRWSAINGVPVEFTATGERLAAAPRDRGRPAADGAGGAGERRQARLRVARRPDPVLHGGRRDAGRARRRGRASRCASRRRRTAAPASA